MLRQSALGGLNEIGWDLLPVGQITDGQATTLNAWEHGT